MKLFVVGGTGCVPRTGLVSGAKDCRQPVAAEDGGEVDGRNETKGSVAVDMCDPDGSRGGLEHNAQCRLTSCDRVFRRRCRRLPMYNYEPHLESAKELSACKRRAGLARPSR
jgi:hypothetical protein